MLPTIALAMSASTLLLPSAFCAWLLTIKSTGIVGAMVCRCRNSAATACYNFVISLVEIVIAAILLRLCRCNNRCAVVIGTYTASNCLPCRCQHHSRAVSDDTHHFESLALPVNRLGLWILIAEQSLARDLGNAAE
jgi:hypothetical protein